MSDQTVKKREPAISLDEIAELVRENSLFSRFTKKQIDELVSIIGDPITLQPGEVVVHEGDPPDNVYIIRRGSTEVLKKEFDSEFEYRIALLGVGDTIGEVSLLDSGPRSATVRCLEETSLLSIPIDKLEQMSHAEESVDTRMKINLAYELGHRLRNSNVATVRNLKEKLAEAETRAEMGRFMTRILIGTCIYMFLLGVTTALSDRLPDTTLVSVPILLGFAVGLFLTLKTSIYPLSAYGLTTENWRPVVKEALLYTAGLAAVVVLVKVSLVSFLPAFEGLPIFDLYRSKGTTLGMVLLAGMLYALFVPIQEGVARGVQASLQLFLIGRYSVVWAILVSNLLFSATHLHVSVGLALLVFPIGVFWGWMFYRQKTLIGVILSHILIGLFSLFIVGFPTH